MIELHNADCLDAMRLMEDNAFELAIVDPPYGIGNKFKGGNSGKMQFNEIVNKGWDSTPPSEEYFFHLMRVTKNQIIWGGNYFNLPPTRCFVVWDKKISENFTLAMCELAWTSFDKLAKIKRLNNLSPNKIHPTQKPVALYTWLLEKYAKPNDRILDTHLGSGSIAIAAHNLGYDLTGYELDPDYYQAATQRLKNHQKQLRMF